jgi:hypothetical protein
VALLGRGRPPSALDRCIHRTGVLTGVGARIGVDSGVADSIGLWVGVALGRAAPLHAARTVAKRLRIVASTSRSAVSPTFVSAPHPFTQRRDRRSDLTMIQGSQHRRRAYLSLAQSGRTTPTVVGQSIICHSLRWWQPADLGHRS